MIEDGENYSLAEQGNTGAGASRTSRDGWLEEFGNVNAIVHKVVTSH